jgi:hypothetical protein
VDEHQQSAFLDAKCPTNGVTLWSSSAYAVLTLPLSGSEIISAVLVVVFAYISSGMQKYMEL